MPNWSYNTMHVHAKDDSEVKEVQRLRDFIKTVEKDENGKEVEVPFSFDKIIPMPKELDVVSRVFAKGQELSDEDKELVEKYKENIKKYGAKDWYDWRWEHWGTKWDACDATYCEDSEPNDLDIKFDTAWSFPAPIVVKLSRLFPTLVFCYDATEESGAYDFTVNFKNGEVIYYAVWEETKDGKRVQRQMKKEDFWK